MIDGGLERRLAELSLARAALSLRAAGARRAMGVAAGEIAPALSLADQALVWIRYAKAHPFLAGSLAAVAVAVLRKRLGTLSTLWLAWRTAGRWLG